MIECRTGSRTYDDHVRLGTHDHRERTPPICGHLYGGREGTLARMGKSPTVNGRQPGFIPGGLQVVVVEPKQTQPSYVRSEKNRVPEI